MVVLFIIVFIFLFASVIWGISAIVGGIGRAFSSKPERSAPKKMPQARPQALAQEAAPPVPVSAASSPPATTEKAAELESARQSGLSYTLEQLERISRLRKDGTLTEDEFLQIKAKLIQEFHRI